MNKTLQKLIAGISALAMATALTVSAVPAFALEPKAVLEDKFVMSFKDAQTQEAAQYILDNGISLDDAKDLMASYEHGLELIAQRSASTTNEVSTYSSSGPIETNRPFYSGTQTAQSQHYGVLIKDNPSATVSATIRLSYTPTWIYYDFSALNYTVIDTTSTIFFQKDTTINNCITTGGYLPASSNTALFQTLLEFPFDTINDTSSSENYSESTIYNNFTLNIVNSTALNNINTTYTFHTYAIGDVDHSGYVDDADYTYIMQFLLTQYDYLGFSYTDVPDNIAAYLNFLSTDADRDGTLTMSDAIIISRLAKS